MAAEQAQILCREDYRSTLLTPEDVLHDPRIYKGSVATGRQALYVCDRTEGLPHNPTLIAILAKTLGLRARKFLTGLGGGIIDPDDVDDILLLGNTYGMSVMDIITCIVQAEPPEIMRGGCAGYYSIFEGYEYEFDTVMLQLSSSEIPMNYDPRMFDRSLTDGVCLVSGFSARAHDLNPLEEVYMLADALGTTIILAAENSEILNNKNYLMNIGLGIVCAMCNPESTVL